MRPAPMRPALLLTTALTLVPALGCAQTPATPASGETMVLTQGDVAVPLSQLRVVPQGATTPMPLAAALATTGSGLPTNTTIAGLPVSSNPSATALANAIAPMLPGGSPATATAAGLVKVPSSSGLAVAADGTITAPGLLPTTTTIAGLSVSGNPSAAALAAQVAPMLPLGSTSAPGVLQVDGSTIRVASGVASVPSTAFDAPGAAAAVAARTIAGMPLTASIPAASLANALTGTGAGSLAAGNDTRIAGALQTSAAGPLATVSGSTPLAAATAALGLSGSTATFLRSDGTQVTPPSASLVTSSSPGLVPATTGTGTKAFSDAGTYIGILAQDAAGAINPQKVSPPNGAVLRTLSQRAGDIFNARDYGASGTNAATALSTAYPSITSVATMAGYTNAEGQTPFSWATNQVFGLVTSLPVATTQGAASTLLDFHENFVNPGYTAASIAPWQDPAHRNVLLKPGTLVSGSCIAAGTTISSLQTTTIRQMIQYPGAPNNAPQRVSNQTYDVGAVYAVGTAEYVVIAAPANGNGGYTGTSGTTAPAAGNIGRSITDGTLTVAYFPPAGVDYSNGLSVPAGNVVYDNGGFYQNVGATATTASSGAGPTGTGSSITDGGVTFSYLMAAESKQLPSGAINLSQATSSACAAGTSITFTLAPSDLEARTTDWLGIQSAMAWAWLNVNNQGGRAYLPAGVYLINGPLVNAAGNLNNSVDNLGIEVVGDGRANTQVLLTGDLPQDWYAMAEGNEANGTTSQSTYADFSLGFEPGVAGNYAHGYSPHLADGLLIGANARVLRMNIGGFANGILASQNHAQVKDVNLANNGCGYTRANYSSTYGNDDIEDSGVGSEIAGVCVTETNTLDAAMLKNDHTGFGPIGFLKLPNQPNITQGLNGLVTDSEFLAIPIESVGLAEFYGDTALSAVGQDTFSGGGPVGFSSQYYGWPNGLGGTIQAKALAYVASFSNSTMTNTEWGGAYPGYTNGHLTSGTTDAPIETTSGSGCQNDEWINDTSFVTGAQYLVPPLICSNTTGDYFSIASGRGFFAPTLGGFGDFRPYDPVGWWETSTQIGHYMEGFPFVGALAQTAVNPNTNAIKQGNIAAIITEGLGVPINVADHTQSLWQGEGLFPTQYPYGNNGALPGVAGALDPHDAVAVAYNGYNAGANAYTASTAPGVTPNTLPGWYVTANLGPHGGEQRVSTNLTAGAAGSCTVMGSSPYGLGSAIAEFTSVPSGGCVQLPIMPIGGISTIINDGTNPMTVYPPISYNFYGLSAGTAAAINVPANGGRGSYQRISASTEH